jgi:hypothetical protein
MKKFLLALLLVLGGGAGVNAADSTVSNLPNLASPTTDDLLYVVDDPGGTPVSNKATIANVLAAGDARVATLTNKTIDCDAGSGNVCTVSSKVWMPFAQCNNATAVLLWDSPTSNAAAAACYGSNTVKGVADFDASTDESLHLFFPLPSDFSGAVDAVLFWSAAATSGTVRWGIRIDCYASGESHDVASSNSTTFAGTPDGTTNRLVRTAQTAITTTGCAASELAKIQVFRDADGGSGTDDMSGDARGIGLELTFRRAM